MSLNTPAKATKATHKAIKATLKVPPPAKVRNLISHLQPLVIANIRKIKVTRVKILQDIKVNHTVKDIIQTTISP